MVVIFFDFLVGFDYLGAGYLLGSWIELNKVYESLRK